MHGHVGFMGIKMIGNFNILCILYLLIADLLVINFMIYSNDKFLVADWRGNEWTSDSFYELFNFVINYSWWYFTEICC